MQDQDRVMDQAAEDVRIIRDMMEKAERSLRESSSFFLWAGCVFLVSFIRGLLQNFSLMIIGVNGRNLALISYISNFFGILEWVGMVIIYFVYRSKSRRAGETVGRQLCSVWGFLLIGGMVIGRLMSPVMQLALGSQLDGGSARICSLMPHFIRCLLIAVGLFVSGLLLDKFLWKVFAVLTILLTLMVLVLSRFTIEIPLAENASMSFAPAAMVMTALPAVAMLTVWAVVRSRK